MHDITPPLSERARMLLDYVQYLNTIINDNDTSSPQNKILIETMETALDKITQEILNYKDEFEREPLSSLP